MTTTATNENPLQYCSCTHQNASQCMANLYGMTMVDAMLAYGACTCYCHRDLHGKWEGRLAPELVRMLDAREKRA